MSSRIVPMKLLVVVVAGLGLTLEGRSAPPGAKLGQSIRSLKEPEVSLNDLSMEVDALVTLHRFQMTKKQLQTLRRLAPETAEKAGSRDVPKATSEYRKALMALHAALVKGETDDRIAQLEEKLDDVDDATEPDLDDEVTVTLAARNSTPEVQAMLSKGQVERFLEDEDEGTPLALLLAVLDKPGQLKGEEGKELKDEIVEMMAWQVGGADAGKFDSVAGKVDAWLNRVTSLNGGKGQRAEMERAARGIVGKTTPETIRANRVAQTLAELLSNPRLAAAVDARLKK